MVKIKITGADVSGILKRLSEKGIVLYEIQQVDFLSAEFTTSYFDYTRIKKLSKGVNHSLRVLQISGLESFVMRLKKRYVFLTVFCFLIFLSVWLPSRVLFISVEGNHTVPTVRILQKAEACGIYFGAKRNVVRSEIVKNNLLESLPQLRWAGINTHGCTAVISVQEESTLEQKEKELKFSNIVASRDGVVISITATSGYPICEVGQAVTRGQVLVSGSQNDGILFKTRRAQAEVFAQTNRQLQVATPIQYSKKGLAARQQSRYSLIIGKKRINLSKGSGISYTGCDKMYQEYHLTLPGGFVLPVSFAIETFIEHDTSLVSIPDLDAQTFLIEYGDAYLSNQMVSGRSIARNFRYSNLNDMALMESNYVCIEMIARERAEELDFYYGKDH